MASKISALDQLAPLEEALDSEAPGLGAFQRESVDIFVRAAVAFSLPKSVGQIYGLLFASEDPLSLDDITVVLGSSRAGTFEGLRWLRQVGAVEGVHLPGVRKEYFRANLNLRKLAAGFLRIRIEPHLENGHDHLARLRESVAKRGAASEFESARAAQLERWHKFASNVLPLIKALAGRA